MVCGDVFFGVRSGVMVFCFLSSEGFVLGVVRSYRSEGWGLNYGNRWGLVFWWWCFELWGEWVWFLELVLIF